MSSVIATPMPVTLETEIKNLRTYLKNALWMPQHLDITMAKLDVIARPGSDGGSAKLKNEQNPIAFDAFFAHEQLRRALSVTVNDIQQCRAACAMLPDETTGALAQWLLDGDQLVWLSQSHLWRNTYNSIIEGVSGAHKAIDLPEYEEPTLDNLMRTIQNIPAYVLDAYATAPKIVEALKIHGITNLNRNRIHAWADDKPDELVAVVRPIVKARYSGYWLTQEIVNTPTYRLRDVCNLWLAAELKKQATLLKKQAAAERKAVRLAKKSELAMAA
ncbi:hypothetical protein SAMN04489743_2832 [Pseudarthrobacter equi]|uniref:Uncharacterized protein n=1 Tax=Pseudarthrobacter equi TaxID=728066 RepID=A0A1H2A7U5_9MICC|nr:hypothetical protein [Pseudarthrobacter equi]SDT41944.1 hypothetical protein SAMN04489743_2832 [Pseudarthrobacter equi]